MHKRVETLIPTQSPGICLTLHSLQGNRGAPPGGHIAAQGRVSSRGDAYVPPGIKRSGTRQPRQAHLTEGFQRRARAVQQRHAARSRCARLRPQAGLRFTPLRLCRICMSMVGSPTLTLLHLCRISMTPSGVDQQHNANFPTSPQ